MALAGAAGKVLEWQLTTPGAAAMIYMASDPDLDRIPDFYMDDDDALRDIRLMADLESHAALKVWEKEGSAPMGDVVTSGNAPWNRNYKGDE